MKNEILKAKANEVMTIRREYPFTTEQARIAITFADSTIDDETASILADILVQQRNSGFKDGYRLGYSDGQAGAVYQNI